MRFLRLKVAVCQQNKIMSRPFQPVLTLNSHNPEQEHQQSALFSPSEIDPSLHQLSQNYFTYAQLTQQSGYQVVNGKDWLYFGGMDNGSRHGFGVLITKHTLYEGGFSLHRKMGQGFMRFPSGATYFGDFVNDKPHGRGLLALGEEYYMGDFENGAMEGDGLWKKNGEKYVGRWKGNRAHGHGIYITDKSHYQGCFYQFVKQGYGVQTFANGDEYRGHYQGGRPHGHGEYRWDSGAVYIGEFRQGVRQGEGQWTGESGDEYKGHYSADRKNGWGEFKWANGNVYRGEFCEDMREGQGEMRWADESTYEGEWRRGLPNGKGMFKAKGQKPRMGLFEDNILVSESRTKPSMSLARQSQTELLKMIPQVTKRKKSFKRRAGKSVNPSSTNSTTMTFKIKRSVNKSHYT